MAKPFVDGTTAASADNMNKLVYGDGTGETPMLLGLQIYYDGADWQCATAGSGVTPGIRSIIASSGLTWNSTTDELEIDLSVLDASYRSFTSIPICVAAASCPGGASPSTANYIPQADADTADDVTVRFFDEVTGAHITTEGTQMDFHLLLYGLTS